MMLWKNHENNSSRKKKNESKNEETQSSSETDEDVMSLLPEELRPMRLVDIASSNNRKASGKKDTDEDDDIPRSNFSRWQDNFALMKLHTYLMDEISMEPKMEFDAMPSEIDNLFMKMRKAHSLFQSIT